MPSEQGQHKAFSTCLPHLAVVSLFVSAGFFSYLKPSSISFPSLDLVVAVLYSLVPPTLNPIIYSVRNKDIKCAVRKVTSHVSELSSLYSHFLPSLVSFAVIVL